MHLHGRGRAGGEGQGAGGAPREVEAQGRCGGAGAMAAASPGGGAGAMAAASPGGGSLTALVGDQEPGGVRRFVVCVDLAKNGQVPPSWSGFSTFGTGW